MGPRAGILRHDSHRKGDKAGEAPPSVRIDAGQEFFALVRDRRLTIGLEQLHCCPVRNRADREPPLVLVRTT